MRYTDIQSRYVVALSGAVMLFLCTFGCATNTVRTRIECLPKAIGNTHRYSAGNYKGLISIDNTDYLAFWFGDAFYSGCDPNFPRSPRILTILLPVANSKGKRAIIYNFHSIGTEEFLTCLRGFGLSSHATSSIHDIMGVGVATLHIGFSDSELLGLAGFEESRLSRGIMNVQPENPGIVGVLLDDNDRAILARVATRTGGEVDGATWRWSAPYEVADCRAKPTLSDKIERALLTCSYVFTVPFDVITFPFQKLYSTRYVRP